MNVQPQCTATAIGSLPYPDPAQAVELVLQLDPRCARSGPNCPNWACASRWKSNIPKVCRGSSSTRRNPGCSLDTSGDTSEELAAFYEGYMAAEESGDYSVAAISPEFSAGIPALEAQTQNAGQETPLRQSPGHRARSPSP